MADRRTRGWVALLALLALIVGAAACGDDDDDDTGSPTDDTAEEASGPSEDEEAFCGAVLGVAALRGPEEETPEAIEAYGDEVAKPAVAAVVETAPDDAAEDAEALSAGLDQALTGDTEAFEEAIAPLAERAADLCDWSSADVAAVDYGFEGLDASYDAGALRVAFTNEGDEQHEFLVFRKKDGVEESFEELFELPEAEVEQKIEMAGATFAMPGQETSAVLELTAGDYVAVCFIPVGSTVEAVEAAEAEGTEIDGPPHFTEGMIAEFSVS